MNTLECMRLLCDGQMPLQDVRSILLSSGHSQDDFGRALVALSAEESSSIRVGKYVKTEMQAELYLSAGTQ